MLDRKVVEEFLDQRLKDSEIQIPSYIRKEALVETFCRYVEDDYYEWLKSNFSDFFQQDVQNKTNWAWVDQQVNKTLSF